MTSQSRSDGEVSTFPSYEDLHNFQTGGPRRSDDAVRICWNLQSPLETAISVMEGKYYVADAEREPYFNADTVGWHSISRSFVSEPKISSVTVSIDLLRSYADNWEEFHRGDSEPDWDNDPSRVIWGLLLGFESMGVRLLKCCGEERPNMSSSLRVRASGEFLTIHDYVSQLHPWLMERRQDLLGALTILNGGTAVPAETELMVAFFRPNTLIVQKKDEWVSFMKQPRIIPPVPSPEALEERNRLIREFLESHRPGIE